MRPIVEDLAHRLPATIELTVVAMVISVLVGIPLVIVTVTDETVGVAAATVYALAFTVELGVGLASYFGGEAKA